MANEWIIHGIYMYKNHITPEGAVIRKGFFENDICALRYIYMDSRLEETLKRKAKSWRNKVKYIEFTYGYNDNYAVLTIVSPKDQFNRKRGYQITMGRLKNAKRILEKEAKEQETLKYTTVIGDPRTKDTQIVRLTK